MSPGRAARQLAPAAIAWLLAVVLLAPATLGGRILSAGDLPLYAAPFLTKAEGERPQNKLQFDSAFVFEPDGLLVRQALREGRLPVWTDALSAGRPLLAAQQSAPLFPLTWISAVFPYWESLAWIVVLKLTLAALGTILLARALGIGLAAALVGGIAFGFGTYMVDWLMHPHTNAYLMLPWLFLFAERLCRTGALRQAALLGGALGLAYLGGHPQSSFLLSMAAAAWFVYRLLALRPARAEAVRRTALAMAAAVLGLALAAVMLVPFAEALSEAYATSRAAEPLEARAGLAMFFPEFWGRPDRAEVPLGPANFTERTIYVGVLPMLLAVAGLVARRPCGPQLFFGGLVVTTLAVVLDTGPLTDLVSGLPGLESINLNRLLIVTSFGLAMLAAYGTERFLRGTEYERRRMLVAVAATAVVPALAVVIAHPSWIGELGPSAKRLLGLASPLTGDVVALAATLRWLLLSAAVLAVLAAFAFRRLRPALFAGAAVGLVALDLLVMGYGYNPAITKSEATPPRPPAVDVMGGLTERGGRVAGIGGLEPNTASRWGLDDARGHEQPVVERNQRLWLALGGGTDGATLALAPVDPRTPALLDLFGVRAVLLSPLFLQRSEVVFEPLRPDPVVYAERDGVVLARPSALPPAFVAYRWRPSEGLDESLRLVAGASPGQARNEPVVETSRRPAASAPAVATRARVLSRSDTDVRLRVDARAAGQLVLADTFYPGWEAEVDGEPVDIRPANAAFRAVEVGPGRHEVRFSYRPASVLWGAVISVVALLLLLAGLVFSRRHSPGSPGGSRAEVAADDPWSGAAEPRKVREEA